MLYWKPNGTKYPCELISREQVKPGMSVFYKIKLLEDSGGHEAGSTILAFDFHLEGLKKGI